MPALLPPHHTCNPIATLEAVKLPVGRWRHLCSPSLRPPCASTLTLARAASPLPAPQAAAAIQTLNGAPVPGGQLVVKFADADVQPRVESGRQPSEWWCACCCRPTYCTSASAAAPGLQHACPAPPELPAAAAAAAIHHESKHCLPALTSSCAQLLPQPARHVHAAGCGRDVPAIRHGARDPPVSAARGGSALGCAPAASRAASCEAPHRRVSSVRRMCSARAGPPTPFPLSPSPPLCCAASPAQSCTRAAARWCSCRAWSRQQQPSKRSTAASRVAPHSPCSCATLTAQV